MYRKGVSLLVLNQNQEFLLVNLQSFETRFFAVPGGGVENNESLEEAAYREIEEELGIKKESLEIVGISKNPLRFKFKVIKLERDGVEYEGSERYFLGFKFVGNNSEIVPSEVEVRSYKWVPLSELRSYLLFDNQFESTLGKIYELFPSIADK